MNLSLLLSLTLVIGLLLFLFQRTDPKKKLIVLLILLVPAELIRRFIVFRDINSEGLIAFFLALFLNFLFWLLIGRYNPVRSSDDSIQVIGMDD
jgi:hypothetical protein